MTNEPPGSKVSAAPEDALADYVLELTTEELTAIRVTVDGNPKEATEELARSVLGIR